VGFAARRAAKSVTSACRAVEGPPSLAAAAGGQTALVLDTPGLGDAARSEEEVYEEIRRGLQELVPHGSQACLLLVLSIAARVGEDEFNTLQGLRDNIFGSQMLDSALVVWTHGDLLGEGGLAEYLEGLDPRLQELLANVRGGQVVLSNADVGQVGPEAPQVESLLAHAVAVAGPFIVMKARSKFGGRKAARRQRQLEAGLIRDPRRNAANSGGKCMVS